MTEKQLQAQIVLDFSQKRPNERGLLWATMNRTLSIRDGQTQLAMGMIPGVSDLIYFKNGNLICIELKEKGKSHDKKHILKQLNWGKIIEANGGVYCIITSLDEFWLLINDGICIYDIREIEKLLENSKSKVVFV